MAQQFLAQARLRLSSPLSLSCLLAFSFALGLSACSPGDSGSSGADSRTQPYAAEPYTLTAEAFSIEGELESFTSQLHLEEIAPDLYELRVRISAPEAAEPPAFRVRWNLPAVDIAGYWNTNLGLDRVNYYRNSVQTRATSGAPVLSHYNPGNVNRLTVAVSDALNPVGMSSWVREEDARF